MAKINLFEEAKDLYENNLPLFLDKYTIDIKEELAREKDVKEVQDKLAKADIPVITIAGSVQIGGYLTMAHDSMMQAFLEAAENKKIEAYGVDVLDYLTTEKERKGILDMAKLPRIVVRTEMGSRLLHNPIVQKLRGGLGFEEVLKDKILKLVDKVSKDKVIVTYHYGTAKTLVEAGYKVLVAVTDPSVELTHNGYFDFLNSENKDRVFYGTMDKETKDWFIKEIGIPKKNIKEVGCFVSPKIIKAGSKKIKNREKRWEECTQGEERFHISLFTGGLGTNFWEMRDAVLNLVPLLCDEKITIDVFFNTNTDLDKHLKDVLKKVCCKEKISIFSSIDKEELNNKSIEIFKKTDLVLTKPSGDKAFEALASAAIPLFLFPLHPHEIMIREYVMNGGVGEIAKIEDLKKQIEKILSNKQMFTKQIYQTHNINNKNAIKLDGVSNLLQFWQQL